jgi:hypothetical protein
LRSIIFFPARVRQLQVLWALLAQVPGRLVRVWLLAASTL